MRIARLLAPLLFLAACGDPVGVCLYQDDPDLGNTCWEDSVEEFCGDDPFVKHGSCVDEGYTFECFAGVYARDEDSCFTE